jgi:hypothetical protein
MDLASSQTINHIQIIELIRSNLVFRRRTFLKTGDALASSAALGISATGARAEIMLGETRLDVVSDGALLLPGSFIFDTMPQDELLPLLAHLGQSAETLTPPCNVTLLRRGDRTVLFDIGSGPGFSPNSGILLSSLEALGVDHDLAARAPEPLPRRSWRQALVDDMGWAREYLVPWVVRRIRHQSSGDLITAKRPDAQHPRD